MAVGIEFLLDVGWRLPAFKQVTMELGAVRSSCFSDDHHVDCNCEDDICHDIDDCEDDIDPDGYNHK